MSPIEPLATHALLLDICLAGGRLVAAGEYGVIVYSDDDGVDWKQARVPTEQMLTGVYFADARHGWAVGHDGLVLASENGGEDWHIQRDGLAVQHRLNLEARDRDRQRVQALEQRLAVADAAGKEQIKQDLADARQDLDDAELTLSEPTFTSPLMNVWFQDTKLGWAVGAFNTLVATRDGGQTWTNQEGELDNPDELHLNAITGDGKGRVFIAGESGIMFRSLDSGRTWETLQPFYEGSWFGTVYDASHDALLVFGLRGNLYRSTDFGTSWQAVDTANHNTLAGGNAIAGEPIVLAGSEGTVLISDDGGLTFRTTAVEDHLALSSGISHKGRTILVGQGGIKTLGNQTTHE